MKRILTLLLVLTLSLSVNAQKKKGKGDMAKKVTTEMTTVLGLDNDTAAKVLELQKERLASQKAAKKDLKADKKALKVKKKEIIADFRSKLENVIGKDKVAKWTKHVASRKKSKKRKK